MKKFQDLCALSRSTFFSDDTLLQTILSCFVTQEEFSRLNNILELWQSHMPKWHDLADEAARSEKLPRIQKYDFVGNAIEKVIIPLETKTIRQEVVNAGIFKNQSEVE